jgi:hypothetical protein
MKRKTLYVLIFVVLFFYGAMNNVLIEPLNSIYDAISSLTDAEWLAAILTPLFPCIFIWVLFDNSLKKLDK